MVGVRVVAISWASSPYPRPPLQTRPRSPITGKEGACPPGLQAYFTLFVSNHNGCRDSIDSSGKQFKENSAANNLRPPNVNSKGYGLIPFVISFRDARQNVTVFVQLGFSRHALSIHPILKMPLLPYSVQFRYPAASSTQCNVMRQRCG